jgi:cyclopropane fatty-acyl-phospholipid synthase-like methyltransferase
VTDVRATKLVRLGAKLCLQPNQKVLDIGFGWGRLTNAFLAYQKNPVETAALMPVT